MTNCRVYRQLRYGAIRQRPAAAAAVAAAVDAAAAGGGGISKPKKRLQGSAFRLQLNAWVKKARGAEGLL